MAGLNPQYDPLFSPLKWFDPNLSSSAGFFDPSFIGGSGGTNTVNLSARLSATLKVGAGLTTTSTLSGLVTNKLTAWAGASSSSLLSARTSFTLKDAAGVSGSISLAGKATLQEKTQAGVQGSAPLSGAARQALKAQAGLSTQSSLTGRSIYQNKAQAGVSGSVPLSGRGALQEKTQAGATTTSRLSGALEIQLRASGSASGYALLAGLAKAALRGAAAPTSKIALSGSSSLQLKIQGNPTTTSPLSSLAGSVKFQLQTTASPSFILPFAAKSIFTLRSRSGVVGVIPLIDLAVFQAKLRLFAQVSGGALPAPKYIMTTSGTYVFNPPIGRMALLAFARCGIHGTEILQQHMENAWMECNLLQADWAADGITWWTVELVSTPLVQGTATYSVAQNIISVLDVYISNGSSNRLIYPFSRTDYASLAEPNTQGFPTTFWFNRALSPTITLWPVPDNNASYTMNYYAYTQTQDANIQNGGNAAVPYFWLNAYIADLAHRLSRIYAPALEPARKQDMIDAYARANKQVEPSDLYITAGLNGYYR